MLSMLLASYPAYAIPPSVEEIIQHLERIESDFFGQQSLYVRYERTESVDLIETVASGGYLPAEWEFLYADSGKTWLMTRRFTQPGGAGSADDPIIPGGKRIYHLRDGITLEWRGRPRASAHVRKFKRFGHNIFAGFFYTNNLSLDTGRHIVASVGDLDQMPELRRQFGDALDHPFLPQFLIDNQRQYSVRPAQEFVDGAACWVVEWPSTDRIWVDPQKGFAVRRRIYHWGPGKPERYELRNSDFRLAARDLWLPYSLTQIRFASIVAERQAIWGKPASRSEFRVHELAFNNIPPGVFPVKLPKGTYVADGVRDIRYQVAGGGGDPFAEEIAEAREVLRAHRFRRLVIWINAAVIIVVLFLLVFRAWRLRRDAMAS